MTNELDKFRSKWWFPLVDFCCHVFIGSMIFIVIAIPAVLLSMLIAFLEQHKINSFICLGLEVIEYSLFIADVLLFLIFLISSIIKTGRKLWQD